MKIELISENHEYSSTETGELLLYDNDELKIGLLEYHIDSNKSVLHVDNLKNMSNGLYSGVGTALMNEAVKISLKQKVGFAFEIAKGSEQFYQTWITRSFEQDNNDAKSKNLFFRISSAGTDRNFKRLTNHGMTYTYHQLKQNCKINFENNSTSAVKKIENKTLGI